MVLMAHSVATSKLVAANANQIFFFGQPRFPQFALSSRTSVSTFLHFTSKTSQGLVWGNY